MPAGRYGWRIVLEAVLGACQDHGFCHGVCPGRRLILEGNVDVYSGLPAVKHSIALGNPSLVHVLDLPGVALSRTCMRRCVHSTCVRLGHMADRQDQAIVVPGFEPYVTTCSGLHRQAGWRPVGEGMRLSGADPVRR